MHELIAIEAKLDDILARLPEADEHKQALQDLIEILATMGQVREVLQANRERLERADHERADIRILLVQLRELMRKQVRATTDLTQVVTEAIEPQQQERGNGE